MNKTFQIIFCTFVIVTSSNSYAESSLGEIENHSSGEKSQIPLPTTTNSTEAEKPQFILNWEKLVREAEIAKKSTDPVERIEAQKILSDNNVLTKLATLLKAAPKIRYSLEAYLSKLEGEFIQSPTDKLYTLDGQFMPMLLSNSATAIETEVCPNYFKSMWPTKLKLVADAIKSDKWDEKPEAGLVLNHLLNLDYNGFSRDVSYMKSRQSNDIRPVAHFLPVVYAYAFGKLTDEQFLDEAKDFESQFENNGGCDGRTHKEFRNAVLAHAQKFSQTYQSSLNTNRQERIKSILSGKSVPASQDEAAAVYSATPIFGPMGKPDMKQHYFDGKIERIDTNQLIVSTGENDKQWFIVNYAGKGTTNNADLLANAGDYVFVGSYTSNQSIKLTNGAIKTAIGIAAVYIERGSLSPTLEEAKLKKAEEILIENQRNH